MPFKTWDFSRSPYQAGWDSLTSGARQLWTGQEEPPQTYGPKRRTDINLPPMPQQNLGPVELPPARTSQGLPELPGERLSTDMQRMPADPPRAESYKIRDKRTGKDYTWWDFRPPTPQQARAYIWEQENQSLWEKINAPLTRMPSRAVRKIVQGGKQEPSPFGIKQKLSDLIQPNSEDDPDTAYWKGMGQGTLTGIGDLASEMTNIPNLIGSAASFGTYGAAASGLPKAAKGFSAIEKIIAGGQMAHGGARMGTGLYEGDMSEMGAGAFELGMGGLGWMGSRVPNFGDDVPAPPTTRLGRDTEIREGLVPYRAPKGDIGDIVEGEVVRGRLAPYEQKLLPDPMEGRGKPPGPSTGPYYTGKYGAVGTDINKVETTFQPPDLPPPDLPAVVPPKRGGALRNPATGLTRASDADLEFAARTGDKAAALEIRNRQKAIKAEQAGITRQGLIDEEQGGQTLEDIGADPALIQKLRGSLGKEKPPTKQRAPKIKDDDLLFMAEQGDQAAIAEARKRGLIRGQAGKTGRAPGDLGKLRSQVRGRFIDEDNLFDTRSRDFRHDWEGTRSRGLLEARAGVQRGLNWENQITDVEIPGRQGLYTETVGIPVRDSVIRRRALEDRLEKMPPDDAFAPDSKQGRALIKAKKQLIREIEHLSEAQLRAESLIGGGKSKVRGTYDDPDKFLADIDAEPTTKWTGGDPDAALADTLEREAMQGGKGRNLPAKTSTVKDLEGTLKSYTDAIKNAEKQGKSRDYIWNMELRAAEIRKNLIQAKSNQSRRVKGDNKTVALFRRELPVTNKRENMRFILPDGTKLTHFSDIHAEAARSIGSDLDEAMQQGVVRWSGYGAETQSPITTAQAQEIADAAFYSSSESVWMDVDTSRYGGRRASRGFKKGDSADKIETWVNSHFSDNRTPMSNREMLLKQGNKAELLDKYTDEELGDVLYNMERNIQPAFFEPRGKAPESAGPEIEKNMEMQLRVKDAGGIGVLSDDVKAVMDDEGITDIKEAVKKVSGGLGSDFVDFLTDVLTRRWGGGSERGATNLDFLTGGIFSRKGKAKTVRPAKNKKPGRFSKLVQPAKGTRYETDFADWVNTKKAATVEGILKGKEFAELKELGKDGIRAFVNGSRTGKLGDVNKYLYEKYQEMVRSGLKTTREHHRLTDIWEGTEAEIKAAYEKMGKKQSYTFDKLIPDLKTGMNAGLNPKFQDMSEFVRWYETKTNRTMANKKFVNKFIEKGWLKPEGQTEPGWKSVDQYIRAGQKRLTASPEFHDLIRSHLGDESKINKWMGDFSSLGKNFSMSAGVPLPKPGGSFHGVLEPTAINSHGLNILARTVIGNPKQALKHAKYLVNPKSAKVDLDANLHRAADAVKKGLTLTTEGYEFGTPGGSSDLVSGIVGEKAGKYLTKGLEQTGKLFEDPLFQQVIPSIKLKHWIDLEADFMKGGMSRENAGKAAAEFTNELYGGINWEALGRSKDLQNLGRAFILAPDWAETNARLAKHVPSSFFQKGGPLNSKYRAAAYSLIAAYGAANVVNYALSGHLMVQNAPGHTLDIDLGTGPGDKKAWFRPFGTAADFARLPFDIVAGAAGEMIPGRMEPSDLSQASMIAKNRTSIPLGAGINWLSRRDRFGRPVGAKDDYGRPISPGKQAWAMTEEGLGMITPPYVKSGADYLLGDISGVEALAGGFETPFKFSSQPRDSGSRTRSQRSRRESR